MNRKKTEQNYEAVYFIEDHQVYRQMLKSEFEALLDGYVGLSDMADSEAHIVYAVTDRKLNVQAMVFFLLYFDDEGRADQEWNVKIEELARKGGPGPNLGNGPIRLACRSQCPINWYQKELWDPELKSGANDVLAVNKAIKENRLGFEVVSEVPQLTQSLSDEQIPVLQSDDDFLSLDQVDDDYNDSLVTMAEGDHDQRTRLASMIRTQRLRIRTLEGIKQDKLEQLEREQRLEAQRFKNDIIELKQSNAQLQVLNEQLKKKLFERNEQNLQLQDRMMAQSDLVADLQNKLRGKENVEEERAQATQTKAELVSSKEEIANLKAQLSEKNEQLDELMEEREQLQEKFDELRNEGSLFEKLHALDVVFMSYHPGAGHVTIPFVDIKRYAANPSGYVAAKCFVTEEDYLRWLKHYENPTCQFVNEKDGNKCRHPLSVVHAPNEYKPGISDLCAVHRKRF